VTFEKGVELKRGQQYNNNTFVWSKKGCMAKAARWESPRKAITQEERDEEIEIKKKTLTE